MSKFNLDSVPLLGSFKDLQYGDTVYSRKYGLGQVYGFYGEEIIIQFSNLRKRFSIEDGEIRKIPDEYFKEVNKKVRVNYEGKEMSYTGYKKAVGLTKKQLKEDQKKHITLKEAAEILDISKAVLFETIEMNNIKTRTFGRSVMIHRDDLLRLYKKGGREK